MSKKNKSAQGSEAEQDAQVSPAKKGAKKSVKERNLELKRKIESGEYKIANDETDGGAD